MDKAINPIKLLVVFLLLPLIVISPIGCGCHGQGVPSMEIAPYQVESEELHIIQIIFVESYEIQDGVLYTDGYWGYSGGSVFSPVFAYFGSTLALSDFLVSERTGRYLEGVDKQ